MTNVSANAMDHRARRAAKRAGLVALKSRRHVGSIDNFAGFMLIDPMTNFVVDGARFDLTADEVIERCASE
jgi:hypothetical protein